MSCQLIFSANLPATQGINTNRPEDDEDEPGYNLFAMYPLNNWLSEML